MELKSGLQPLGKSVFVVGFAGVESREAAEALIGQTLMVPFVEAIVQKVNLEAGWLLLTRPLPKRDPRSTRLHEMQAGHLSKHLVITDQCALQSKSVGGNQ